MDVELLNKVEKVISARVGELPRYVIENREPQEEASLVYVVYLHMHAHDLQGP